MAALRALLEGTFRAPVMLAPMAGLSTPPLVAAASNAGVLGFHGGAFRTAPQLADDIVAIRRQTAAPFGVNIFAHAPPRDDAATAARVAAARTQLAQFAERLCVALPEGCPAPRHLQDEQVETLLAHRVPFVSFCFGVLDPAVIRDLQHRGTCVMGTATSCAEAAALADAGVDAIVAQGADAGGHRGSFTDAGNALVGTMSLVPQVVACVPHIPVVAAGGIMDARGVVAALALGADAAAMGTAFITSAESEAHALHKQRILESAETDTVVTDVFSGRPARGLVNDLATGYMKRASGEQQLRTLAQDPAVAPYPLQQALVAPLKAASLGDGGRGECASMWAGQGLTLCTEDTCAAIVDRLCSEIETVLTRTASRLAGVRAA